MASIRTMPIRTLLTIVGILATMLMVLLTAPDSAQALAKPIGGNSKLAQECRAIRNNADALIDEYNRRGTTPARRRQIISELRNAQSDWHATGCQGAYGDIVRDTGGKPTGGRPGSGATHAGDAGVAPVGGAPPAHTPVGGSRPTHGGDAGVAPVGGAPPAQTL
jgi:hypothetical protein